MQVHGHNARAGSGGGGGGGGVSAVGRRPRKSRGRGLRTTTGCAVCRKRHMKCDEAKPICGPCSKAKRDCTYASLPGDDAPGDRVASTLTSPVSQGSSFGSHGPRNASISSSSETLSAGLPYTAQAAGDPPTSSPRRSYSGSNAHGTETAPMHGARQLVTDTGLAALGSMSLKSPVDQAEFQSHALSSDGTGNYEPPPRPFPLLKAREETQSDPSREAATPESNDASGDADEPACWQTARPLELKDYEHRMFHRFVFGVSEWIDLFDPLRHFSTFVPHLAMRNEGLMKAILALGARHLSLKPASAGAMDTDRTAAMQYYYETLQYLQSAMRYTSYKNSLELLATTLVVSTYEMIDGAGQGWEGHLRGAFWIQRSRELNGESGGLEQAVWWAWLRQDVWAAFREHRRCFSFFKPAKPYRSMDVWDMASRVVYLLAQAVNYSSDEERRCGDGDGDLSRRITRANTLFEMLFEWRSSISEHFQYLPTEDTGARPFKPLWIHPPAFGTSVQMYCMAIILLLIHQPAARGYREYVVERDKSIMESVDSIGGIALRLTDDASRVMSTQCLFAAGLYCVDRAKRACIADLIHEHAAHTGWPSNVDLVEELRAEWRRQEQKPG